MLADVLVLLDQKDWIGLARADRQRNAEAVYVELLAAVRALKAAGWTFLLNTSRYHETSQTPSVRHRRDVAMIMQEISDYHGLLDPTTCLHMEMSAALHARVPEVTAIQFPVLGRGATHIFGMVGMRVAEDRLPADLHAEAQGLIDAYMTESADWFEFGALAGEAVTQGLAPRTAAEIHAAALARGREFEIAEQRREMQLREHAGADWSELQRITRGVTVLEFYDDWATVISHSGLPVGDTMAKDGDHDVSIASDVPALDVISALRARRFPDGGRPWSRTDFFDVVSMQHAIPYCDLVSTDRHWAHLANRTHLAERYATTITGRPSELLATLNRLG